MSGSHHHDPIEENIETHPLKLAIGIAGGAIALVVGIILLVQYAVGAYGSRSLTDDPAMAPEAVAMRIAPAARVAVEPKAPAAAVPAAAAATGKSTYDSVCAVCHASGVAGAPKFGDKAAWMPRLKAGKGALHASALKGKAAMPPKGGNASLSDDDVKAAVDYLLSAVK